MPFFIDTHCHFSTIQDIPLADFFQRCIDSIDFRFSALLVGCGAMDEFRKRMYSAVSYFEQECSETVASFVTEIDTAFTIEYAQIDQELLQTIKQTAQYKRIITPLIMDFEYQTSSLGKLTNCKKLSLHTHRILSTLKNNTFSPTILFYPFIGCDPRRFSHSCKPSDIQSFLKSLEIPYSFSSKKLPPSGTCIGIKLYPPLGFDIFPDKGTTQQTFIDLYSCLASLSCPVTVHCAEEGFCMTDQSTQFTHPSNWVNVFNTLHNKKSLRINFAHFGGLPQILNTIRWRRRPKGVYEFDGLHTETWTYQILGFLKKYPHMYADLSSIDFSHKHVCLVLGWLISLDATGVLDELGPYRLYNKLLWGTDYPLITLFGSTVTKQMSGFFSMLDIKNYESYGYTRDGSERYLTPYESIQTDHLPRPSILLEKITSTNPLHFLFGHCNFNISDQ